MQTDFWGNIVTKPLKRNLQELASPLSDPEPVPFFRGSNYEVIASGACQKQLYIGNTGVATPPSYAAEVLGYAFISTTVSGGTVPTDLGIGDMAISTTFVVY
jgi:hypothetical protein